MHSTQQKERRKLLKVEEMKPGFYAVEVDSDAFRNSSAEEFHAMLTELVDESARALSVGPAVAVVDADD